MPHIDYCRSVFLSFAHLFIGRSMRMFEDVAYADILSLVRLELPSLCEWSLT